MTLSYSDQMKKETLYDLSKALEEIFDELDLVLDRVDTLEIIYSDELVEVGHEDSMKKVMKELQQIKDSVTEKIDSVKKRISEYEQ